MPDAVKQRRRVAKTLKAGEGSSREFILETAIRLFADVGFEGASMRDLAEAAGFNTPTIYHFFGDKRGLYNAAVLTCYDRIERNVEAPLMTRQSPGLRLRRFLENLLVYHLANHAYTRLHVRVYLDNDPELESVLAGQSLQPPYDALRRTLNRIRDGAGEGPLPIILMSTLFGYAMILPFRQHLKTYADAVRDIATEQEKILDTVMQLVKMPAPCGLRDAP